MVGDTMLTSNNDVSRRRDGLPSEFGVLKLLVMRPHIAIAFAGKHELANDAIARIAHDTDAQEIERILLDAHLQSHQQVDFMLASWGPTPTLRVIKEGKAEESDVGWIGNIDAFRRYQAHSLNVAPAPNDPVNSTFVRMHRTLDEDETSQQLFQQMVGAMNAVIDAGVEDNVGGITTAVAIQEGEFHYLGQVQVSRKPLKPDELEGPGWHDITYGTVHDGSHAIESVECETPNGRTIAIHQLYGDLGIYYDRQQPGFPNPTSHERHDAISFLDRLEEEYKVRCSGFIYHKKLEFHLAKCEKLIRDEQHKPAQRLLGTALRYFPRNDLRWQLHRMRGWSRLLTGDFILAIEDATEALKTEPNDTISFMIRGNARSMLAEKSHDAEMLRMALSDYKQVPPRDPNHTYAVDHAATVQQILDNWLNV
jgi:hypothetical protein